MTDTPNTAALKALCKAQQAMTGALKDSNNPHFNKKYADLGAVQDACFPAFHANGFSVMHQIRNEESGSVLDTILLHESGASWTCPVPLIVSKNDMQALGSAITYARRYGLMCLSGVAPEDDDGNKATENKPANARDRVGAVDKPVPYVPEDIEGDLAKISTITDADELDSYFKAVRETTPEVAKRPDFIAACKVQKAIIEAKETS